jgi:hypothetical protein
MTRVCCPSCRLRFTGAPAASLTSCPHCDEVLQPVVSAALTMGYRLYDVVDPLPAMPTAVAVALPVDGPQPGQG